MKKSNCSKIESYPFACVFQGARTVLIWKTGPGGDHFAVDSGGRLIAASSTGRLKQLLGKEARNVRWSQGGKRNLDAFWGALKSLRPGRASSKRICTLLIDGWNFIEDMLKTFDLRKGLKRLRGRNPNRVYKKLFYGMNLPSVTPEGKSYDPIWTRDEVRATQKALGEVWTLLENKFAANRPKGIEIKRG